MTRRVLIELIRRQIYGSFPTDDAEITPNLVNQWLELGIAFAAQKNYTDGIKLDGIAYINNSFYTTYKDLTVTKDEKNLWKIELPSIPFGLGQSEGISTLKFKGDTPVKISYPVIWLSMNQLSYQQGMRQIPNKILAYSEGKYVYVISDITLSDYTAIATMVSGGISTDMDSEINVPSDYITAIVEYVKGQLQFQRMQPVDLNPDGADFVKSV